MNGLLKNEHGEVRQQRTREAITRSNLVLGNDNQREARSNSRGPTSKTFRTSEWGVPGKTAPEETFGKKNSTETYGFHGKKMFDFGKNMGMKQKGMHSQPYEAPSAPVETKKVQFKK
jgi:hypothetical protein